MKALVDNMDGEALVPLEAAIKLLELVYANLEFDEDQEDERNAPGKLRNQVFLIAASDRNVVRVREEGRFSNAPDTKQQENRARGKAHTVPVLMLLRQKGSEEKGWRGLPFRWPIIAVPRDAVTSVFAAEAPEEDSTSGSPDG